MMIFAAAAKLAMTASLLFSAHGYTVQPGDTLSEIAASHGVSLASLEAANPQIANPDLIYAGDAVSLPGEPPADTASSAPDPVPGGGDLADVPGVPRAFAACVAFRESSDNPRAVNSIPGFTGNGGGAYGFLASTWHSLGYGGQPYDAPVWQQKQAFSRLYAQAGKQPWSPSDGCP